MRRFVGLAAALFAVVAATGSPAAASFSAPTIFRGDSVTVAIVDEPAMPPDALLLGLGVYPGSRNAEDFLAQVGSGAPSGDASGGRGEPLDLVRALGGGVRVETTGRRALLFAYGGPFAPASRDARGDIPTLRVVDGDDPGADLVIVIPSNGRTPVPIVLRGEGYKGLLDGGQTRRSGIVTPYDLSASIVAHFSQPVPPHFPGRVLMGDPAGDPAAALGVIARRLVRDASFMQSLTAWTVGIGLGFGWLVAWPLAFAGRQALSRRVTVGASTVTIGFLIGLFVPSARGDVRALPMLALFIVAAAIRWRDPEATAMRFFVVASGGTAILAVIAASAPGGVAAHALWGNPLVSWRFFGLQNFAAAFVAGGAIVGATRLGLRALPLALLSLALLVVVGSPRLGANFVAVLTFAFGAAFAVVAVRKAALKPAHAMAAAGVAVAAFALALLADAGGASSHGGAAAQQIGRGGLAALWEITYDRLRLNIRAINAFPGGWAWAAGFLGLYALMIRDAWTSHDWPLPRRAAIAAGALSGLAALALEDSGFKTTAVLGFPALLLWTLARAGRPLFPRKTAGQGARA